MSRVPSLLFRAVFILGASFTLLGLSPPAFAAREAANEVGRGVGFGNQV
jgi:hypothetical protein